MFGNKAAKNLAGAFGNVRNRAAAGAGAPPAMPGGGGAMGGLRQRVMQNVMQRRQGAAPAAPPTAGGGGAMGAPQTPVRVYSNGGKVYNRKPNGKGC